MKSRSLILALPLGLIGFVAVAALLLGAVGPRPMFHSDGRPACGQLPTRSAVEDALRSHAQFVRLIESAGPAVEVRAGTPCGDDDRALVSIRVASDDEREAVSRMLQDGPGFGVPAEIDRA